MRKNGWILVILVVVLALSACQAQSTPPLIPTVTVNDLLGSIDNAQMNVVKFIEFDSEYVIMELNGQRHKVVPDSLYIENEAYLVYFTSDHGEPFFYTKDPFDEIDWEWEWKINPSMEYYVFRDYQHGVSLEEPTSFNPMDENALGIVLVPVDKIPEVVDWRTWIGTEATIGVWTYPRRYPWVVQNLTTNEIAFFKCSVTVVGENGNEEDVVPISSSFNKGMLSEGKDSNDCPILILNQ